MGTESKKYTAKDLARRLLEEDSEDKDSMFTYFATRLAHEVLGPTEVIANTKEYTCEYCGGSGWLYDGKRCDVCIGS